MLSVSCRQECSRSSKHAEATYITTAHTGDVVAFVGSCPDVGFLIRGLALGALAGVIVWVFREGKGGKRIGKRKRRVGREKRMPESVMLEL